MLEEEKCGYVTKENRIGTSLYTLSMGMSEKICKICLKTKCDGFQRLKAVDNNSYKVLRKLDLEIYNETILCYECMEHLKVSLYFISTCISLRNITKDCVSWNLEEFENTGNAKSMDESRDQVKCCLCTKTAVTGDFTLLDESKENIFLVNMLEKYIPELNLNNTQGLLICETCEDSLQGILSLIKICEDAKKIYGELKNEDQVELNTVKEFAMEPTLRKYDMDGCDAMKTEQLGNQILDGFMIKVEIDDLKDKEDIDNQEFDIKTEEIHIKHEHNSEMFQEVINDHAKTSSFHHTKCSFSTDCEIELGNHGFAHKTSSVKPDYKCEMCTFSTTYKKNFDRHRRGTCVYETKEEKYVKQNMLVLEGTSDVRVYKCKICAYETKFKTALTRHLKIHKNPSEIYKCKVCKYGTKHKGYLQQHMYVHTNDKQTNLYKCEVCSFETEHKRSLNRHMSVHKNPSEVTMYKCGICTYETRFIYQLKMHILIHKGPAEVKMYKCDKCPYETKRKCQLKSHVLTHKNSSELTMYKCEMCIFESKYKSALNRHILSHKNISEKTKYKCEICKYATMHKSYLKLHVLIHNPSDVTTYNCQVCGFVTKHKYHLMEHMVTHKDPSEIAMYKCEMCKYEARHKRYLKKHMLIHKNATEVKMHKCDMCNYETKHRRVLAKHLITHKRNH